MKLNDDKRKMRSDRYKNKQAFFKRLFKKQIYEEINEEEVIEQEVDKTAVELEEAEEEVESRDESEKSPKPKKRLLKRVMISSAVTALALFIIGLIGYTVILYGGSLLVDEEKLVITPPTTIETVDGEIIWYLYDEYRLPVKLDQIPEHVQEAFIAVEDKRFYDHGGIDIKSIGRAVYKDIVAGGKVEGASTITQQLAKNLFLTNEKSWLRKTQEVMISLHMEREYTKEEILEMYLNVIYFGHGQYGIEAAANKYFMKSVEELTLEEGAMLAGMIKAPNTNSPIDAPGKAKERRDLVLELMFAGEQITEEQWQAAKTTEITLNVSNRVFNPVYHSFVDYTIREAAEKYGLTLEELRANRYRIITSMNGDFQTVAYDQFQFGSYFPGNNDEVEGSFVMMDQQSGGLLALIGGRDFEVGDLNRVTVEKQPGSTFKPIAVFAPALMTGNYEPFTVIPDEKVERNGHVVKNVDDTYLGSVTFYDALRYSKNTSSDWLLNEMGVEYAKGYLVKMGIDIEDKGAAIALGGLKYGVTPIQMAQAYRVFNQQGKKVEAHAISEIHNYQGTVIGAADNEVVEVFTPQVAWSITEMLLSVVETGTAKAGEYDKELAGKTGTTQHPRAGKGRVKDAWFVGYTPEYVTALWMGYDDATEENYLTAGSRYPTELTKRILTEIDKVSPLAGTFSKPDDVDEIAPPITLPVVDDVRAEYIFGGFKLLKGKLTWTVPLDERIIFHVYKRTNKGDEKIGEVTGKGEFTIDNISIFQTDSYFVLPIDPLSGLEGEPSAAVKLSF